MRFVLSHDVARFAQFAARVWDVEPDFRNPERTALEGIARLESFFRSIGLPVRLSELGVGDERIGEMADKSVVKGNGYLGNFVRLDAAAVREILMAAR